MSSTDILDRQLEGLPLIGKQPAPASARAGRGDVGPPAGGAGEQADLTAAFAPPDALAPVSYDPPDNETDLDPAALYWLAHELGSFVDELDEPPVTAAGHTGRQVPAARAPRRRRGANRSGGASPGADGSFSWDQDLAWWSPPLGQPLAWPVEDEIPSPQAARDDAAEQQLAAPLAMAEPAVRPAPRGRRRSGLALKLALGGLTLAAAAALAFFFGFESYARTAEPRPARDADLPSGVEAGSTPGLEQLTSQPQLRLRQPRSITAVAPAGKLADQPTTAAGERPLPPAAPLPQLPPKYVPSGI